MSGKRGFKQGTLAQFQFHLKAMRRACNGMPPEDRDRFSALLALSVLGEEAASADLDSLIKAHGFLVPCQPGRSFL